ncbi:TPA: TerB family tellurite resistance protein [Vibrio parahaemolyticus]|uniref:tellurite resistance TerB family protein n=1 Tax=Vibrio parahaemolyticus TaxID=670 RepID=UPI0004468F76|nr:TerB family tellurite resistance protein [Vibrio parahaemolyticus]EJG0871444.1 TerB family tellurite resistance protein [Vibrio parahaemolyticus O3]EJG0900103.1 TerB family tellurite resistance protein [Vibrio parahaemolyticus O3:K56]EJG1072954.1 TerB family tellurite resistance protein [Vibrio parahaemolyticus O1:K56]EII3144758.1 TerB family tellurite resistance protein [Vibrio parahaemolyticus]EJG0935844.1 TerB family tellurite resistance protein [Vibrio parahaemolyticus]
MIDILSTIKEAAKENNAFENHAAKELSLEERLLYLQGLALIMNADGEMHEDEKNYLLILVKSLELDESIIDSCIEFANQPDKNIVQSILKYFKRKPIAQLFLFDAFMISVRDGDISVSEKNVIDELASQFEVPKGTYRDIFDFFCHVKNKNWQDSALYFNTYLLSPKFFSHILKYYEVNLNDLTQRSKEISKRRILANIKDKIKDGFDNEVLLPLLQSKISRREATVQNGMLISADMSDVKLKSIKLGYDQLNESLYVELPSLINDNTLIEYYYNSLGITEIERYMLEDGSKNIISSNVDQNKRILNLTTKFTEGSLIDINGILCGYKKYKGKPDIVGLSSIYSTTMKNFDQIKKYKELMLHSSLTDKTIQGTLYRIF